MQSSDMAPLTAWLPARSSQDFDLIVKLVGPCMSTFLKEWLPVSRFLVDRGFAVIAQGERLDVEAGDFILSLRIASRTFYSIGHGCDVFVHVGDTVPEFWRFGLQPGSVLLWEPPRAAGQGPILPEGIIVYPVPLTDLCARYGEGASAKGFCALGALLYLLGLSEESLRHLSSLVKAPLSFAVGSDFARNAIEKRDGYSLPLLSTDDAQRGMVLTPEQAILLGCAVGSCECRTACEKELAASPVQWTARHLDSAGAMVSVLESDGHPGVQAYQGSKGKVLALLRGDDSSIASCLNGFTAPRVFVAADIPDAFNLVIAGHDLIRTGLSDGVGILIEETIALRHQTVEIRSLLDMVRRVHTLVSPSAIRSGQERSILLSERDGDTEADVGFVAWGAAQGVVRDAVALCRSFGLRVAGFYPKQIVPFSYEDMESFAKSVGRVVLVDSDHARGYWDRLRESFSFEPATVAPELGRSLTPMDIFLREGLGTV
jgi:hypothetical protein